MATIRTRKRGKTFSYSFDAGKHPATGRRRIVERGGFSTEQAAYDAGAAAYAAWKAGNIGITSERVPLRDYLAAWVETVARPNVAQGTYGGYVTTIRARIVPYIGGIILQELRPRDVDRWMSQLAANGFSRQTIAGARVVLSHALKYAVYPAELIAANPCAGLSVPRSAPAAVIPRVIISPAILATLFQKFPEGHKYHIIFRLAYHTGARIGEILGLSWDDIDIDAGRIVIQRQIVHDKTGGGYFFTVPKTDAGRRTIYVDGVLLAALRKWRAICSMNAVRMGRAYQCTYETAAGQLHTEPRAETPPDDWTLRTLVCVDRFGLPVRYSAVQTVLKGFGLNAHSFRHTHATRLIEAGAKPVDVAARLGHSDATITQNLYTHDTDEMRKETAAIFARIVGE